MQRYAKAFGQLLVNKVVKTYEKLQYKKAIRVSETSLKAKKYDVTARQPNWRCKLNEITFSHFREYVKYPRGAILRGFLCLYELIEIDEKIFC